MDVHGLLGPSDDEEGRAPEGGERCSSVSTVSHNQRGLQKGTSMATGACIVLSMIALSSALIHYVI